MEKAVQILVEGRVQGVFFRKFVKDSALKFGVNGFIKNLHDGSVQCFCVGSERSLKNILEQIRVGPPGAKVEKVTVTNVELKEKFSSFQIRN